MDFPEKEDQFQRNWSLAAGHLYGVKQCIVEAEKRAASAFNRHQDDVAHALRDLTAELRRMSEELAKHVQGYIEENRRRKIPA